MGPIVLKEECLEEFKKMGVAKKTAFIIFKTGKGGQDKIEIETLVSKADSNDYLDEYCTTIKESGQPRFSVVDWNQKLFFITWCPDKSASVKDKMRYSGIQDKFIGVLDAKFIEIMACNDNELTKDVIENAK